MKNSAFARTERVNEQVHRELAQLISLGVKNPILAPALKKVTLTGVAVTSDYTHANVFYTVLAGTEATTTIAAAEHALGAINSFLRRELAHRLRIHHIPELHFKYDDSVARGVRLSKLIDDAVKSDQQHEV